MDKIFSARMEESVIRQIENLARQLKTTRKQIIESAITHYSNKVEGETRTDILDRTFGAWKRDEKVSETFGKSRKAFQDSMQRHRK